VTVPSGCAVTWLSTAPPSATTTPGWENSTPSMPAARATSTGSKVTVWGNAAAPVAASGRMITGPSSAGASSGRHRPNSMGGHAIISITSHYGKRSPIPPPGLASGREGGMPLGGAICTDRKEPAPCCRSSCPYSSVLHGRPTSSTCRRRGSPSPTGWASPGRPTTPWRLARA